MVRVLNLHLFLEDKDSKNSVVRNNATMLMPALGGIQPMMYNAGAFATPAVTMQAMPYGTGQAMPYGTQLPNFGTTASMPYVSSHPGLSHYSMNQFGTEQPMGYQQTPAQMMTYGTMQYGTPSAGYGTPTTPTTAKQNPSSKGNDLMLGLDLRDITDSLEGLDDGTETVQNADGTTQVIPSMETMIMPVFKTK